MKKEMLRKILVMGIIVLFVGVFSFSLPANSVSLSKVSDNNDLLSIPRGGRIIYVDDDNTEGPWNGTKEHPYKRIRDGIKVAENGDTVYVFSGLYKENRITIAKSISLIGQDKKTTIVDGKNCEYSYIFVLKDDCSVLLSGFTLQNCGRWSEALIINNHFNIISGNIIKNNYKMGICIGFKAKFNRIYGNIISNNGRGVYLRYHSNFNQIYDNNIINNRYYGILLECYAVFNTIKNNNFIDNGCNAFFSDSYPNKWMSNYWYDWNGSGPYRIKGEKLVFVGYDEYGWPEYDWVTVYDYDYSPAEEPNDITTTQEYDINCNLGTIDTTMIERFPILERFLNLIQGRTI